MASDPEEDEFVSVLSRVSKRSPASEVVSPSPAPTLQPPAPLAVEAAPLLKAVTPIQYDASGFDYVAQLLTPTRNKKGKGIQLDSDNHRTLTHIAHIMGIALADLLQNIVRLHFQQYGPAIQKMLSEKERLNKKERLLFQQG